MIVTLSTKLVYLLNSIEFSLKIFIKINPTERRLLPKLSFSLSLSLLGKYLTEDDAMWLNETRELDGTSNTETKYEEERNVEAKVERTRKMKKKEERKEQERGNKEQS